MPSQNTKEEEIKSFLTDEVGMDADAVEEQADEMLENDEVLLRVNAYEKIKEENVAQPQEELDVEGAFLGEQTRTNSDNEVTGYVTWVFSADDHEVVNINSDVSLVDGEPRPFTEVAISEVQRYENLETGYQWLQASDESEAEFGDGRLTDLVYDFAQTVGEVVEDNPYLVITTISDVDTIPRFHEESEEYLGREPVIEDEDNSNIKLIFEDQRDGSEATMKLGDPRAIANLMGTDLGRLMKIAAKKDAQEMAQQIRQVLEGEEIVTFARGSLYVEDDELDRPWLTLSNFDMGFLISLEELEAEE